MGKCSCLCRGKLAEIRKWYIAFEEMGLVHAIIVLTCSVRQIQTHMYSSWRDIQLFPFLFNLRFEKTVGLKD